MADYGESETKAAPDLFDKLKGKACKAWKAQAEYREKMREDFDFAAGHQWTDTEKQAFEDLNRKAVTFDFTSTLLASVAGNEINNRTEVRFIPREIGDIKPNEILTAGAQWFRDDADAEDGESHAFIEMLQAGIGWTETYLDFDADDEGKPCVERRDPLEMFWDAHCTSKGLKDGNYSGRVRCMPFDEVEDMFPGISREDAHCAWLDKKRDAEGIEHNIIGDEYRDGDATSEGLNDLVTVVQIQWRERVKTVQFIEPTTGEKTEMPAKDWQKIEKAGLTQGLQSRSLNKWCWYQAFLGNTKILKRNEPCKEACTFRAMTGHWDRKDKRFYGLLAVMRDPQKYLNKWLSQTLHIINVNSKGGLLVEADAIEDVRAFEESWAAADAISWVRPGRLGSIQEKSGVQWPAALMQLTEFALTALPRVSGVSLELQGLKDAQQAGVLEYQRRQAAMVTLAHYFDALRFYRKLQGHVILSFLVNHIAPTGRLVRIVREGLAQYVPLATDPDTRKYDVIVDDAPTAPNEKERAWAVLEKMLPILIDRIPPELLVDVLEHSPLPGALIEKLRSYMEEQRNKPQPPNPEEEKVKSETAENESQTALNYAKAQETMVEAQHKPAIMAYDAETKRMTQMERAKHDGMAAETSRFSAQSKARNDETSVRNRAEADRGNLQVKAAIASRPPAAR